MNSSISISPSPSTSASSIIFRICSASQFCIYLIIADTQREARESDRTAHTQPTNAGAPHNPARCTFPTLDRMHLLLLVSANHTTRSQKSAAKSKGKYLLVGHVLAHVHQNICHLLRQRHMSTDVPNNPFNLHRYLE